jgi:hypothetical protein
MPLPAVLNEDTIPVVLRKQLGINPLGDWELHLLAGMPVKAPEVISSATVTAAVTTTGALSTNEGTKLVAELIRRKAAK